MFNYSFDMRKKFKRIWFKWKFCIQNSGLMFAVDGTPYCQNVIYPWSVTLERRSCIILHEYGLRFGRGKEDARHIILVILKKLKNPSYYTLCSCSTYPPLDAHSLIRLQIHKRHLELPLICKRLFISAPKQRLQPTSFVAKILSINYSFDYAKEI